MTQHADGRSELIAIIHDVRRRWRMKLALRGAAIAAGCVAVALVGSALTLQWMRFTPDSILLFRILLAMVVAVLAYLCIVRPLLRRVSDEQVALYLEEHEPSLEAAIISAVEAEGAGLRRSHRRSCASSWRPRPRNAAPSKTGGASNGIPSGVIPARSAACSRWPRRFSCSAPPTCGTRCPRCW